MALLAVAVIAACGDTVSTPGPDEVMDGGTADADHDSGGMMSSGGGEQGGTSFDSGSAADTGVPFDPASGADLPLAAFPTTAPPSLTGYTLVEQFAPAFFSGAMTMEWAAGSNRPFILQRGGHVRRMKANLIDSDVVLDFSASVALVAEAGALGFALHPKFADAMDPHPYAYIWYNAAGTPTKQTLSRFTWNGTAFTSEFKLIVQTEQSSEHNGARIRFGPDGFLYFGNGDDTFDAKAQKLDGGLFSGIFRIDVDMNAATSHAPPRTPTNAVIQGYFIPNSNPFVGVANACEEYFALGFRNPYSFSFDRLTNKLWVGDVGDTWREEISEVVSGGNYQWPFFEGDVRRKAGSTSIGTVRNPLYSYTHAQMADSSATIGGHVYRGVALPELAGKFVYTDYPNGRVWAVDTVTGVRTTLVEDSAGTETGALTDRTPMGWGEDPSGELFLVTPSHIYKLARAPAHTVPLKLSDTHIFRNMISLATSSKLVPYTIKSPLWSDGASKQRWVTIPSSPGTVASTGTITLPSGTLLIKHFELPLSENPMGRTRKLETRVLVMGGPDTAHSSQVIYGLTYKWNAAGTDADLVVEPTEETITDATTTATRLWHYPSMGECWGCHRNENRILGFRGEQLNFAPVATNQLSQLATASVLSAGTIGQSPPPLASPSDTMATIDERASAYMAANCRPCHHPGSTFLGGVSWNANPGVAANSRGLVGAPHHNQPMATALGLPNAPLVAAGNANGSLFIARVRATHGDLRMPPVQRTIVDPVGDAVLTAWVNSLPH